LAFLVVAAVEMRRQPHAAQIRHDYSVVASQKGGKGGPHVAGIAKPMDHDDCRPFATHPYVDRNAVRGDILRFEAGGKWRRLGKSLLAYKN
jgi:hypothetical protein